MICLYIHSSFLEHDINQSMSIISYRYIDNLEYMIISYDNKFTQHNVCTDLEKNAQWSRIYQFGKTEDRHSRVSQVLPPALKNCEYATYCSVMTK